MNAVINRMTPGGFDLRVNRSFGNCPQYIQQRDVQFLPERLKVERNAIAHPINQFDQSLQTLITSVDTFFIASRYSSSAADLTHGVDVSHRGGKPGFVRLDDAYTYTNHLSRLLTFPRPDWKLDLAIRSVHPVGKLLMTIFRR